MPNTRIGLITHVVGESDCPTVLRATIQLAQIAETAGFSSFWVAQHHFGSHRGHAPAPLVLLSAIAQETDAIQLGTAVIAGALENPIRLAEDAVMVDAISGGRLQLGLGAGADQTASEAFGIDHAERHQYLRECLYQLREEFAGNRLRPAADNLQDRLWLATGSADGYALAAELGMGVLAGRRGSPDAEEDNVTAQRLAAYQAHETEHGRIPRTGLSRAMFCAEDYAGARSTLGKSIHRWINDYAPAGRFPPEYTADDYLADRHILVGDPGSILKQFYADPASPFTTDFLVNIPQQHPDFTDNAASIRRFGEVLVGRGKVIESAKW